MVSDKKLIAKFSKTQQWRTCQLKLCENIIVSSLLTLKVCFCQVRFITVALVMVVHLLQNLKFFKKKRKCFCFYKICILIICRKNYFYTKQKFYVEKNYYWKAFVKNMSHLRNVFSYRKYVLQIKMYHFFKYIITQRKKVFDHKKYIC